MAKTFLKILFNIFFVRSQCFDPFLHLDSVFAEYTLYRYNVYSAKKKLGTVVD